MSKKIEFKVIEKEDIFCSDFKNLDTNNIIDFTKKNIAIIYAPNGTGKTSLSKVLNCEKNSRFELKYNGKLFSNESTEKLFHKISDQNCRNIIKGDTGDFILGDNIKRERELKKQIDESFYDLFNNQLIPKLKNNFNISKGSSSLLKDIVPEGRVKEYISSLVNRQNKGKDIEYFEFINEISRLETLQEEKIDDQKFYYLTNDYEKSGSIIKQIMKLKEDNIVKNNNINIIRENETAIDILQEFKDKHQCIVCDNEINNPEHLLEKKKSNKKVAYESLDEKTKTILEKIIEKIGEYDPFKIKENLLKAIGEGNKIYLIDLQNEINKFFNIYKIKLNNLFSTCISDTAIKNMCKEYKETIEKPLTLETEDICYIQEVINENIEKKIILERDNKNHEIQIKIDNQLLLETDREELNLSTGEQNFISLSFELLKARNVKEEIVIIDDPISSFDSIYKNKIAFAIIKFLEGKKQIILTHNTEVIKLLEYQQRGCFNLYMLNNIESELNGFIHINKEEQNLLLNLNELIDFFRCDVYNFIKNEKRFMISVVPFMRGYANIIGDSIAYKKLSKLMHGYEKGRTNVTIIYNKLFKDKEKVKKINNKYSLSVQDILNIDISETEIIDSNKYPLLNRTLYHSIVYLYLRLYVEYNLVNLYINDDIPENYMLAQIIRDSFKGNNQEQINQRVFFNSRKTLLNEFNHFEGNMNIFQPAIDISDDSLKKEKQSILDRIESLRNNKIS